MVMFRAQVYDLDLSGILEVVTQDVQYTEYSTTMITHSDYPEYPRYESSVNPPMVYTGSERAFRLPQPIEYFPSKSLAPISKPPRGGVGQWGRTLAKPAPQYAPRNDNKRIDVRQAYFEHTPTDEHADIFNEIFSKERKVK